MPTVRSVPSPRKWIDSKVRWLDDLEPLACVRACARARRRPDPASRGASRGRPPPTAVRCRARRRRRAAQLPRSAPLRCGPGGHGRCRWPPPTARFTSVRRAGAARDRGPSKKRAVGDVVEGRSDDPPISGELVVPGRFPSDGPSAGPSAWPCARSAERRATGSSYSRMLRARAPTAYALSTTARANRKVVEAGKEERHPGRAERWRPTRTTRSAIGRGAGPQRLGHVSLLGAPEAASSSAGRDRSRGRGRPRIQEGPAQGRASPQRRHSKSGDSGPTTHPPSRISPRSSASAISWLG